MKKGELITVTIIDVSRSGPGVAKHASGLTVFVPFSATGDTVIARVTELKRNFARAELVKLIEPAVDRLTPQCNVFGQCGGCQWQHVPYPLQWQYKLNGIQQALNANKISLTQQITQFPAQHAWNYRNRVQLHGFKNQLGFYAARSHDIVSIDRCDIAVEPINNILGDIKQQGQSQSKPYKVEVEYSTENGLQIHWNSPHAAAGFRQVNDEQNQLLKQWIIDCLVRPQPVLDLYGGSANLSLALARQGREVHCVDSFAPDIAPADWPTNVYLHRSDVLPWLKQRITEILYQRLPVPLSHAAIIDPPRGGLGDQFLEICQRLERLNVNEIIAVGCKTDDWARDIARFTQRGWTLQHVAAFDFFPQTVHVETTAYLTFGS